MAEYYKTLDYEWHHKILEEQLPTIIESLGLDSDGSTGAKVVQITKSEQGYKFVELCDEYYGVTLSQDQMERFIKELQVLAGLTPDPR